MWVMTLDLRGLKDLGGLAKCYIPPLLLNHPHCITTPDLKGFSSRNLKYMRTFAETYPVEQFVRQVAAQIPWFHHCVLLDKIKNNNERQWYIDQTIQHGWSRNVLVHQIASGLFHRQSKAQTLCPL